MVSEAYSEAITETLDILNHTKKEDREKISSSFMEYLKSNASKTYISNLDHTKQIKDMKLKKATIGLLSLIYERFWCDQEEKIEFQKILQQNEEKYQKQMREKYNPETMFVKKEKKEDIESLNIANENNIKSQMNITLYRASKWNKIKNWLFQFFKK